MSRRRRERLWVVVKVESGIPALAEVYRSRRRAKLREQALRQNMPEDSDETGLFAAEPYTGASSRLTRRARLTGPAAS